MKNAQNNLSLRNVYSILIVLFLFIVVPEVYSAGEATFQFAKQSELQHIKSQKPVRIKLKRTSSGKYSWDLTGDDLEEIIKIDKKLRKMLDVR
jgi:hypothetical protein